MAVKAVIFDMYETLITLFESSTYFGVQMAEDAGITSEDFLPSWNKTEEDRTLGRITTKEALGRILRGYNRFSEEILDRIYKKRCISKAECFNHINGEIIPMLSELRKAGIKIGLITNCFSEEALAIRDSILYPYFDVAMMSCEQKLKKPDPQIFLRCLSELSCRPEESIYIGDGGSNELGAAQALNMKVYQAVWYLKEGTTQPKARMPEFTQLENPLDIISKIHSLCAEKQRMNEN